jgi:carboxyl-terminal processing protease
MVVLVDGGSASASEILAGALQEHGIAKLVGTKTYGKGSVQELLKVTDKTSLKVTIAKWLTPNGKSISEGGLTPDYEVKITEADALAKKDVQMEKALELLK